MAQPIAEAFVQLRPRTQGFEKEVKEQLKPALEEAEKASKSFGKSVSDSFDEAGVNVEKLRTRTTLVASAALAGIGLLGRAVVKEASSLNESLNAVNVTFGAAAQGIIALGEDAARAVGLSQNEFNALSVRFSAFAKTIAGDGGDVVGTIEDITLRAADFASVMDLQVADAAALFQSGLAGETESLRRFGIDLSAASVEAYALANGIAAPGREMTEQEKILARYGSLMEQTAQTQGDFANTSGDFANASRVARAEMANASAAIGEALLPALGFLARGFAEVAGFVSQNTGLFLASGVALATLAGGIIAVNTAVTIWKALGTATIIVNKLLALAFDGLAISVTRAQLAMGAIGLVLAAAGTVYALYSSQKDQATEATRRFADALFEEGEAQREAIAELTLANPVISDAFQLLNRLGVSTDELSTFLRTGEGDIAAWAEAIAFAGLDARYANGANDALIESVLAAAAAAGYTEGQLYNMGSALRQLGEEGAVFRNQMATLTALGLAPADKAVRRTGGGVSKLKQEIQRLRDEMGRGFTDAMDRARTALDRAREDFQNFAAQVADSLQSSLNFQSAYQVGQDTGTGFLAGLRSQVEKVQEFSRLTNELLRMGISEAGLQQVLAAGVDAGTAIAQELIAGGAEAITGPQGINALLSATESAAQAVGNQAAGAFRQAGVNTARALVAGIDSVVRTYRLSLRSRNLTRTQLEALRRNFDVAVDLRFQSAGLPEMAQGAIVSGPTPALIGEAGAEAVIPLTRPVRALQLMEAAGLASLVRNSGAGGAAVNIQNATFVSPTDADLVAQKVLVAEKARSFGR